MPLGYTHPLYLLPFDHRHSYLSEMFHVAEPLTPDQHAAVVASKQLIYDGFRAALDGRVAKDRAGILVDEEFGADILRDARRKGYITALSTETSGSDEFEFEYGDDFGAHIESFDPTFAKVLIRYNPEGDAALNRRQAARLKRLSEYCRTTDRKLMLELLVPATDAELAAAGGNRATYDADARPALMERVIRELQDAGVEPDVWKIEGLDRREDCVRMVAAARRDGRTEVGCIVLGRNADRAQVVTWLEAAASVPGFIGFAVGRTTFWDPVAGFVAGTLTREAAVAEIASRFAEWATIFEQHASSKVTT
jgi:myo-inositol catabolism protein IolC